MIPTPPAMNTATQRLIPDSECAQGKCACTTTGCWGECSLKRNPVVFAAPAGQGSALYVFASNAETDRVHAEGRHTIVGTLPAKHTICGPVGQGSAPTDAETFAAHVAESDRKMADPLARVLAERGQGSAPEPLFAQKWSKESDMIESWSGQGSAPSLAPRAVGTYAGCKVWTSSATSGEAGVSDERLRSMWTRAGREGRAIWSVDESETNRHTWQLRCFFRAALAASAEQSMVPSLMRVPSVAERAAAPASVPEGCTCPSGDGSLRWPCPAHAAPEVAQPAAQGNSESGLIAAGLTGLAKHVRAIPLYNRLLGDMEVVDKAIAILANPAPTAGEASAKPVLSKCASLREYQEAMAEWRAAGSVKD